MKLDEILNLNARALSNELFSLAKDELSGLSEEGRLKKSGEIFARICGTLGAKGELTSEKLNAATSALNRAVSAQEEQYLYKIMYEAERLVRQIEEQKKTIKSLMWRNVEAMKESSNLNNSNLKPSDVVVVSAALNDALSKDLELLGILKETSEFAFLSVIEGGRDVNELCREITKNIVYNAIKEGETRKERIFGISRVVVGAAVTVANEAQAYADELLPGAVEGCEDAISKAMAEFREALRFAPDEISADLRARLNELGSMDFGALLRQISDDASEPAKSILAGLSSGAGLKKMMTQLGDKIEDLSGVSMENLRREVAELEKLAGEKIERLANSQSLEAAKTRARELGGRLYDAARNFIDKNKA